jgi:hypothetical protein
MIWYDSISKKKRYVQHVWNICFSLFFSCYKTSTSIRILAIAETGNKTEIGRFCNQWTKNSSNVSKPDEIIVKYEEETIRFNLFSWDGSTLHIRFQPFRKHVFLHFQLICRISQKLKFQKYENFKNKTENPSSPYPRALY